MKRIADGWIDYRTTVMPASVGPPQLQETRRAWYAAVYWMLGQLLEVGEAAVSEDAGAAYLETLHIESRAFVQRVADGEA